MTINAIISQHYLFFTHIITIFFIKELLIFHFSTGVKNTKLLLSV